MLFQRHHLPRQINFCHPTPPHHSTQLRCIKSGGPEKLSSETNAIPWSAERHHDSINTKEMLSVLTTSSQHDVYNSANSPWTALCLSFLGFSSLTHHWGSSPRDLWHEFHQMGSSRPRPHDFPKAGRPEPKCGRHFISESSFSRMDRPGLVSAFFGCKHIATHICTI